jgi:hypothetical protein
LLQFRVGRPPRTEAHQQRQREGADPHTKGSPQGERQPAGIV